MLYIDCPNGVSGDMFLGALLSAGLDESYLRQQLGSLPIRGWGLAVRTRPVQGIQCGDVTVECDEQHPHRGLSDILAVIGASSLTPAEKELARRIFGRLAAAEAKVHGMGVDEIHFHEVGAVDAIVDICGAAIGVCQLAPAAIVCSPLPLGSGFVDCMHGRISVPAPATVELLQGVPVYTNGSVGELVTPTGAAIVSTISTDFGPMPAMTVNRVGYGSGKKDFAVPNIVRLIIGKAHETGAAGAGPAARDHCTSDEVTIIECNIDDMTPELLADAAATLLEQGALDVWQSPVTMKKGRAAVVLSALCSPGSADGLAETVLRTTSTFGVRVRTERRVKLERSEHPVSTPYGPVNVKLGFVAGKPIKAVPEYADCAARARDAGVPTSEVYSAAVGAAREEAKAN